MSRALDLLAVAVVAFVVYRLLVAPLWFGRAVERAPQFSLAGMSGGFERLPAVPGRVVFVDFWASWCGPCKISLPLVERYARAHPEVDVIAVDVGESPAVGGPFAREFSLSHVAFDTDSSVYHAFHASALPTLVVIDPQGFIRKTWVGFNPAIELAMDSARKKFSSR